MRSVQVELYQHYLGHTVMAAIIIITKTAKTNEESVFTIISTFISCGNVHNATVAVVLNLRHFFKAPVHSPILKNYNKVFVF